MNERTLYQVPENDRTKIIEELTEAYGIPVVNIVTTCFYKNADNEVELEFKNNQCTLRGYNKQRPVSPFLQNIYSTPHINITNTRIKYLVAILNSLGVRNMFIGTIQEYEFTTPLGQKIIFRQGSFIGDTISSFADLPTRVLALTSGVIDKKNILEIVKSRGLKKEELFNKMGLVNIKVTKHASLFGIDMSPSTPTLRKRLEHKSNDYFSYLSAFKYITGTDLTSTQPNYTRKKLNLKPISIVIPSYNSEDSILQCLYSIESQLLSRKEKSLISVIIVDDGSEVRVIDIVRNHLQNYSFNLKIIRNEKNVGLSTARNTGISLVNTDHVILLDSDIILAKNYIFEHSIRLQAIPSALFFSLKKNIERTSASMSLERIKLGMPVPDAFNDKRLFRDIESSKFYHSTPKSPSTRDRYIEFLDETNCLANFGNGRTLNGNTLDSMVVGHNISTHTKIIRHVGGFSDKFQGWGMEDAYFGARMISAGNFIIPVFSTGVYHLDHPPRSNSDEQKKAEFKKNIKTYEELLYSN